MSSQRGSGTALIGAAVVIAMLLTGVLAVVLGYLVAEHAVRGAADLVALSGAAAHARGEDACEAAGDLARQNQVSLLRCLVRGDSVKFVVSVTVARRVDAPGPGLPRSVQASANAGRLG